MNKSIKDLYKKRGSNSIENSAGIPAILNSSTEPIKIKLNVNIKKIYYNLNVRKIVSVISAPKMHTYSNGVKAFIALGTVFLLNRVLEWQFNTLPILLGIVASALTETDDHWQSRFKYQAFTVLIFAALSYSVVFTLPWPWVLGLVIAVSAFLLTILGTLSNRFQAISLGSLVLVLYTALSSHSNRELGIGATKMLLGGAIWYGCISVVWIALFPRSAVQARLARLYELLGEYLSLKAKLLEPIREIDLAQTRMALVIQNGKVVQALNLAKESLISRINSGNNEIWLKKSLKQYISAQDIHERTSSSHESYQVLSQAFFHSDVLYRCQRVLVLLGIQAKSYSVSILTNEAPKHKDPIQRSIDDLESSISNLEHLHDNNQSLKALRAVNDNLKTMASVFSELFIDEKQHELQKQLIDRYPTTIKEAIRQLIAHTSLNSAVFRHALRLSLSLLIGYIWMRVSEDHMGYWILLTIVFVSQQHYAATYHRLVQRTLGTVQGLALGWAITQLFPYSLMQTGCIVILGSVFLGSRQTKYILATTSITALLVLTFNQIGLRQELFPARLWDTVIGCFIAGVSAWIVLPNWQRYFWPKLAATSLVTQANYLDEIIKQYQSGKKDNLAYRFKRREAHIADAALSNAYSSMLKEPHNLKNKESERGDFLVISHTLLNYISALGAHRQEKENAHLSQDILDFASQISQELLIISNLILLKDKESHEQIQRKMSAFKSIYLSIKRNSIQQNEIEYLVQAQLCLCCNLLPELYLKIF